MASNTLFPPVVNNTEPAFITYPSSVENPGELQIYFKFSALNSDLDHKDDISVHATVHLKKSGSSVVTTVDGDDTGASAGTFDGSRRLRATQIILNLKPEQVPNTNYWYVTLKNEDIYQSGTFNDHRYDGWLPGSIYKVQIRLSEVLCKNEGIANENVEENQQKWLYDHADQFSEWSTVIYSKCLSDYNLYHADQYVFPHETIQVEPTENLYPQTFQGRIEFLDMDQNREHYDYCSLKIYESDSNKTKIKLIEEVIIYPSEISMDNYNYTIKYDFKASDIDNNVFYYYLLEFSFVTQNKYQSDTFTDWFIYPENAVNICNYKLLTVDTTSEPLVEKIKEDQYRYFTSLGQENDNACVGLKIKYDPTISIDFPNPWLPINLRIVRSSEDTNFTVWEVIKYINLNFEVLPRDAENLNNFLERMDIIYDYSIESNTFYQYGIQSLVDDDPEQWSLIRKLAVTIPNPDYDPEADPPDEDPLFIDIPKQIQRDFEYSYLLGKNQRQLKIKFNDNISNLTPQVYDNKLEPIGSQFPYINRNSKMNYKVFPIAGTISFEMDDNDTFLVNGALDIYNGYAEVRDLHKDDYEGGHYNYGYERRFRQKVIDYLTDETFKLFKSATEGNILVRLRDVNLTPNQQLSRLVYNFSANADEVDTHDLDTLKKYGIIYPGTYVTDWNNVVIDLHTYTEDVDPPHSHGMMTSTPTNIPPVKKNNNSNNEEEEEEG